MMDLPHEFVKRMAERLGDELPAFLRSYEEPYTRGIRLNPFKRVDAVFGPEGLEAQVAWEATGHYLSLASRAGADILHEAGAWYLQEPSAMIPAAVLDPRPGERVLDLCAAPGGKSTQLGLRMAGEGVLVCNEPVYDRAKILSRNIERMGIPNAMVTSGYPDALAACWPEAFDAIQCDAPCSGEGMFRRHPETRLEWTPESPAGCAKRQLEILESAAVMLRPGGRLVYSTCTLNAVENEGVIDQFLSRHPEFTAEAFALPGLDAPEGMLTVYPHRLRGEGHFVAKLRKCGERGGDWPLTRDKALLPDKAALGVLAAFMPGQTADCMLKAGGKTGAEAELRHMPGLPHILPGGHRFAVLRTGLHLGWVKGKVFTPDHAWALSITPPDAQRVHLTEAQARAYQAGETVPADGRGWVLACYAGVPLGWGKVSDGVMKNHYPKGLRRMGQIAK